MCFLQNRYAQAFQLYRELIQQCREGTMEPSRRANVRDQVLLFRRRFELMRLATNRGLTAAILLITTLVGGAVNAVFPDAPIIQGLSVICAIAAFLQVITAAALVVKENSIIQRAMDAELLDLPDLAEAPDKKPAISGIARIELRRPVQKLAGFTIGQ
jgi:Protein of unknown function (DUF2721)